MKIKKGDNVLVLAGKDAKKTGEVIEIDRDNNRVKVAGVNIQAHHKKPRNKDDKGGILKTEGAISVSNVQVVCPACKKATRVGHSIVDGEKVRVCKKCGANLDVKKAKVAKTTTKAAKEEAKTSKTANSEKEVKATTKKTKVETEKTTKSTAKSSKKA